MDDTGQREAARQQVERFVHRFDPSYRRLAYYAALPLVLTPELVNYLRNQFLRAEGVPWVAEADLLLSDLCRPVGYEQYAIDPVVRAYLLAEMETVLGPGQMQAVARLLLSYIRQLAQANPDTLQQQALEVQQWAAMVYLDNHRESVVQQLAKAYQACEAAGKISAAQVQSVQLELDRLVRITQELAQPLRDYPELLAYAQRLRQLLDEPEVVPPAEVLRRFAVAPGIELGVPSVLVPGGALGEPADGLWQTFSYEQVTITFDEDALAADEPDQLPDQLADELAIESFEFDRATVVFQARGHGRKSASEWVIQRSRGQAWQFVEQLTDTVGLEMVAIPAGEFLMESPPDEPRRDGGEGPQHRVRVPEFYLGKYPITQAQWRAVAGLPPVNRALKVDPSRFKGADRPVEQVSWEDAVEFCDRLSHHTGRPYRLPSEAEWEYACRAGTTTPFHFGETITPELANYAGNYTYNHGPKGLARQETTPVGSFEVANAFGLFDMHGNVWEWCLDHWHPNNAGASADGSAWVSDDKGANRLLRGGSWDINPANCRSAVRNYNAPDDHDFILGFRVLCLAARALD
jgi:formylglycine-generating enzyme required for sulfatase activity